MYSQSLGVVWCPSVTHRLIRPGEIRQKVIAVHDELGTFDEDQSFIFKRG